MRAILEALARSLEWSSRTCFAAVIDGLHRHDVPGAAQAGQDRRVRAHQDTALAPINLNDDLMAEGARCNCGRSGGAVEYPFVRWPVVWSPWRR
jgi:hypothetical protein